ncbi:MAG TPA: hypothetical protein DC047_02215 [Blastocatellia bacterium]|nr:hypothetical protein [Blastocatellia bacterium]
MHAAASDLELLLSNKRKSVMSPAEVQIDDAVVVIKANACLCGLPKILFVISIVNYYVRAINKALHLTAR